MIHVGGKTFLVVYTFWRLSVSWTGQSAVANEFSSGERVLPASAILTGELKNEDENKMFAVTGEIGYNSNKNKVINV
jgi:hypothetical protein